MLATIPLFQCCEGTHVLTADGLDNIIWRSTKKLGDDGELVDMVLAGEEGLAFKHLCENASCTPDVYLHVILLPCEHDFWRSVVSCRHITGHLRILNAG